MAFSLTVMARATLNDKKTKPPPLRSTPFFKGVVFPTLKKEIGRFVVVSQ